jgi:trehalose-phosphatase
MPTASGPCDVLPDRGFTTCSRRYRYHLELMDVDQDNFKAAILDMDGVITQTAEVHARAWKAMFDEYLMQRGPKGESHEPFDIDRDYRQYVDGKSRYDGVVSFLRSRGIDLPFGEEGNAPDRETVCGLGNRKNELFQELLQRDGVQVYADALEQIQRWKHQGLKVAVISSSRNCEAVLKAAKLLAFFDVKVDGNDIARLGLPGKPAPDVFWHAAERLGVKPSEAIVVEDAVAGIEAGRKGGFAMVVGMARERETAHLQGAGADCTVHDLRVLQTGSDHPPGETGKQGPLSALAHLDQIATRVQGRALGLFLDYDGTLTPIVRRPEDATLSHEMRVLLSQLAERCTVAIVSGRDRRNAEAMVQLKNLVYAGSHGFDIRTPDGLEMQQEDARQALPDLDEAERRLRERIGTVAGALVERKKFAIAVHYRGVRNDHDLERIEAAVDGVLAEHRGLRKRGGKKIFELQPDVDWDKGHAVLWLAEVLGLKRAGAVIVYLGDDVTDEDAFRALRQVEMGIGIRVALPSSGTDASYYLPDCAAVKQFLESLLPLVGENKVSNHA